jgi:predicted RNA-binding Zn ribbon-like protein
MMDATPDDEFLLAVLNSTPVVGDIRTDEFADAVRTRAWLAGLGGTGSAAELRELLRARELLQATVRGDVDPASLAVMLRGVTRAPSVAGHGIEWNLQVPGERTMAVRAIFAWGAITDRGPGRLRACANDDCRLFLLDHSKANNARWCSMARCGNRMKARRHYDRTRNPPG